MDEEDDGTKEERPTGKCDAGAYLLLILQEREVRSNICSAKP